MNESTKIADPRATGRGVIYHGLDLNYIEVDGGTRYYWYKDGKTSQYFDRAGDALKAEHNGEIEWQ